MPIYEYKCQSCNKELEVFVRRGKEPELCPECHGKLTRKVSLAGVIFKGSGFYVNDSKSQNSGSAKSTAKSSSGSKSEGNAKESTSSPSESKSAEKSTPKSESASSSKPAD